MANDPYRELKSKATVLPHEWRVRAASTKLHKFCDWFIPMKHYITKHGECIEFSNIVDVTIKLFTAFGLVTVARRRLIDIALTLDGSQLTNKLAFVMAGIKLVDLAVKNPLTGMYELDPAKAKEWFLVQSRKWCFPLKICMGKETQQMYQEEFSHIFDLFQKAGEKDQSIFPDWVGINFSNPADMAAIQKVLGIGGAAKVWKFFCHCCSLTSKDIVTPNTGSNICEKCRKKQESRPDWCCFCHEISSTEQTQKYQSALDDLMESWDHDMEKVRREGKLKLLPERDSNSIDYVPNTAEEHIIFISLVKKEMRLRNRTTLRKNLNQLRAEVRECLVAEQQMDELIEQISQSTTRAEAIERIMQFVPCIMHAENRMGIKILTMIFIDGLSNYQGALFSSIDYEKYNTRKKREELYVNRIQKIIRGEILGSYGSEAQWALPSESRTVEGESVLQIGTINMENYKVRKCIQKIDKLIDLSVENNTRKQELKSCLNHYKEMMEILRKKDGDYSKEELDKYDYHAQEFYQLWIKLHGRQGVTNYIHMIGSGHMLEYMRKWGNLHKYSQQGWEALNALIKLFFFRRSNKGGKNSGGTITHLKSKLVPIGRLIQRRMLWVCDLVPPDLFDDDYVVPSRDESAFRDDTGDDVIFDANINDINN